MKHKKCSFGPVAALALISSAFAPAAHAATVISGNLYYTTYQNQGGHGGATTNVWTVQFVYDIAGAIKTFCLGTLTLPCPAAITSTPIATLVGADAIHFDPNDASRHTLIIGEQDANLVATISTSGTGLIEKRADASQAIALGNGQAYAIAFPDNNHLWVMPNNCPPGAGGGVIDTYGWNHIDVIPTPMTGGLTGATGTSGSGMPPETGTAGGMTNLVTGPAIAGTCGPNGFVTGVAFIGAQGYYGTASDFSTSGDFGTISSTFLTVQTMVLDDLNSGMPMNGSLPTHALETDTGWSGCIIASGSSEIWQLCPSGVNGASGTLGDGNFHIISKLNPAGGGNLDQTSLDGMGHMFVANNNGNLLFVDYSASVGKKINDAGSPPFVAQLFLKATLDDIANGGGAPPPAGGCPATQGYWHKIKNWPNVTATIDGITYNGATDQSMVIGGITYTQAQLDALLPSGSLHTGGYVNALSQMIAAVLNLVAGAQTGSPDVIDGDLAALNTLLTSNTFVTGTPPVLVSLSASLQATIASYEDDLNAYNSGAGTAAFNFCKEP